MTKEFKFKQLFRTGSRGTGCSVEVKPEENCDCKLEMSDEAKEGLWKWVDDDWQQEKVALVEFEGYYADGYTPINPTVKHIKYK